MSIQKVLNDMIMFKQNMNDFEDECRCCPQISQNDFGQIISYNEDIIFALNCIKGILKRCENENESD